MINDKNEDLESDLKTILYSNATLNCWVSFQEGWIQWNDSGLFDLIDQRTVT